MAKLPRLPKPGTTFDSTPGRPADDQQVIKISESLIEPRRRHGELLLRQQTDNGSVALDPRLIARNVPAAVQLSDPKYRDWQHRTNELADRGPGSFESRLIVGAAKMVPHLPIVSDVVDAAEVISDLLATRHAEDPRREIARVAGGFVAGRIGGHYGYALGAAAGASAGAAGGPGGAAAGGFVVGHAVGHAAGEAAAAAGERIAAAGVDYFREWRADRALPPRDPSTGRFVSVAPSWQDTAATAASIAPAADAIIARPFEYLARQPRARTVRADESLLSTSKYDDVLAAAPALQRPALAAADVPLAAQSGAVIGRTPARELTSDALQQTSKEAEKIIAAIKEQTQVLRTMGARPTSSAAYAE